MEGLLGKILRDMLRVPEGKLAIPFDDMPSSHKEEKVLTTMTKEERQLLCLLRDVALKLDSLEENHFRQHHEKSDRAHHVCQRFHEDMHALEAEGMCIYDLMFSLIRFRLGSDTKDIAVRRGGIVVQSSSSHGLLGQILERLSERNLTRGETVH